MIICVAAEILLKDTIYYLGLAIRLRMIAGAVTKSSAVQLEKGPPEIAEEDCHDH
jgi:hypothetical protein